jgi:hypothetical protein
VTNEYVEILDPYDWLPGYGENAIALQTEGTDLLVAISYDGENGPSERELQFKGVCSFYMQTFPGPSMLQEMPVDATPLLRGLLVEYPDSNVALSWRNHFGGLRKLRHFSIAFSAENRLLVVVADSVFLKG